MANLSDTDPGDKSAAEIEREVDAERSRVSGTIDQLQDRMSVGNLAQGMWDAVNRHGGDVGRSLGDTVKANPMAVALTGIGLAWLMTSSGRRDVRYRDDRYDDYDDDNRRYRRVRTAGGHDDDVRTGDRYNRDGIVATRARATVPVAGASASPTGDAGSASAGKFGGGEKDAIGSARESVTSAVGAAGARLSGAAGRVGDAADRAHEAGSSAADAARDVVGRTRDAAERGYDGAAEALRDARDGVGRTARDARRRVVAGGGQARDVVDDMMEEQPLVLGALALAIGAAIGGALPRSRVEDDYLGAASDEAWDVAVERAEAESAKAGAVVSRVADEATAMADEAAGKLDEKTPSGREAVEKGKAAAKDAANRLADVAKDEADKQNLGDASAKSGVSSKTPSKG